MHNLIINLQDFRTPTSKVFTGRDRGEKVRKDSKIDVLSEQSGTITIIIPDDIRSINPSFLEEFLVNVVSKLGRNGFYTKLKLENNGRYKVEEDLNDAIDKILREENALA
jgi:hypothetical protein